MFNSHISVSKLLNLCYTFYCITFMIWDLLIFKVETFIILFAFLKYQKGIRNKSRVEQYFLWLIANTYEQMLHKQQTRKAGHIEFNTLKLNITTKICIYLCQYYLWLLWAEINDQKYMEITLIGITSAKASIKSIFSISKDTRITSSHPYPQAQNWRSTASNYLTFPEILTITNIKELYNIVGKGISMIMSQEKGLCFTSNAEELKTTQENLLHLWIE